MTTQFTDPNIGHKGGGGGGDESTARSWRIGVELLNQFYLFIKLYPVFANNRSQEYMYLFDVIFIFNRYCNPWLYVTDTVAKVKAEVFVT